MKSNYRMWLVTLFIVIGSLAMPAAAQAWCGSCCGKTGIIYNENDGRYYSVPGKGHCRLYRSVDGKYVPVHGYCCKKMCRKHHHKCWYKCMVNVRCEIRPAHWWMTTWVPASRECWYVR